MLSLPPNLSQQVTIALVEDIGSGDVTAELVPADQRVTGKVISREAAILCGRPWVNEVFRQLDPSVQLTWTADDGDRVAANQTLFEIAGLARHSQLVFGAIVKRFEVGVRQRPVGERRVFRNG